MERRVAAIPSAVRLLPSMAIALTDEVVPKSYGNLLDMPSEAEVAMFKEAGTEFQLISVIVGLAHLGMRDGVALAMPYALSLIPASKRGAVTHSSIDLVAKLDIQKIIAETELCYAGLNAFTGDWSMHGPLSIFTGDNPYDCFFDELGLVIGQYWLATKYNF